MHSITRAGRAVAKIHRVQVHHATVLQPSRAIALQPHSSFFSTRATTSYLAKPGCTQPSSTAMRQTRWTQRFYSTPSDQAGKEASRAYNTSSTSSSTVAELEQLLAKNDLAGFQQTCVSLQTRGSEVSKDVYHYLLKTLSDSPKVFAPLSSESTTPFDPLNSAIGILTDMSREANMGKAAVQPDRDTLLLLLKVAGSKECIESQMDHGWESAWLLVDAIRHGRLPAVMSSDQWELPDLNVALDQELWKGMFECVHAAGSSKRTQDFLRELNTTTYLMADQLSRSYDVEMDDQLWGYIIQAFGNNKSGSRLKDILPFLPPISEASPELYATVAEALANTGSSQLAANIIDTLYANHQTLSSISPIVALGRQYAKTGDYETLRLDFHIWQEKGTHTEQSKSQLVELHRNFLSASAVALGRMIDVSSATFKSRQADILPKNILPGMTTPPQLNMSEYREAGYLYRRSSDAWTSIPVADRTVEDYDVMMQIQCRLNLLKPAEWSIEGAEKIIGDMKKQGLKPLHRTYQTLMETFSRTREFGGQKEDGKAVDRVMKVYNNMLKDGYTPTSPQEFQPLLDACFSTYSTSPFAAGLWMYSNQHFGASDALDKVEELMRQTLSSSNSGASSNSETPTSEEVSNIYQYHDSTTLATILAGLAHADKVEELYKRWDALPLQGIERDATLYQTLIGASQGQEKLARYALRTIRYDMLKEQPPVPMTSEIFSGLLNCCVRIQDAISARSLISQYTGEVKKTAEWYGPMVRTCLMTEGMEQEGEFLLEEMKKNDMKMDSTFYEFLMEYFVTKREDYAAGREVFKSFVKHEQDEVDVLVEFKKKNMDPSDQDKIVMVSEKDLARRVERLKAPVVDNLVSRIEISQKSAAMLNLLVMSHLRERTQMLEQEKRSGVSVGSAERLKDAQIVVHYLTGETKKKESMAMQSSGCGCASKSPMIPSPCSSNSPSSSSIPSPSALSSSSPASPKAFTKTSGSTGGQLLFVNKYVLGEYIDACIKEGSPAMLDEAQWALNSVLPRVIDQTRFAKDSQRLRQALESARNRQGPGRV
ncbi:hypothetical protein CPC16_011869 [Podila verticillata]|nr:hypothetical protein CPC16_011869 [Podila verticillata]